MKSKKFNYRGESPSRIDNLTDAVFGIAITLLLFNMTNPNSFNDLISFTKTFPAFLISIGYLMLIWIEHSNFSLRFSLNDPWLKLINTIFIGFVIFYVYPLRFLSLLLTRLFYANSGIHIEISSEDIPDLMIYYGGVVFALYFTLFFFYLRALKIRAKLNLNDYEAFFTKYQGIRITIMFTVPLISVLFSLLLRSVSINLASMLAGMSYTLYVPGIIIWKRSFRKRALIFELPADNS